LPKSNQATGLADQAAGQGSSLSGHYYAALTGIADPGSEAQLYRWQALGLLEGITDKLHRRAALVAAQTHSHPTDLVVLLLIYRTGPETPVKASLIQRSLGFTAGGVTRRLNTMERNDLVQRIRDPDDGRAWHVTLTTKGCALAERMLAETQARNEKLYSEFSLAEWKTMIGLLQRLQATVD